MGTVCQGAVKVCRAHIITGLEAFQDTDMYLCIDFWGGSSMSITITSQKLPPALMLMPEQYTIVERILLPATMDELEAPVDSWPHYRFPLAECPRICMLQRQHMRFSLLADHSTPIRR